MVFYFSGTGNSEYAARRLAAALDDTVVSMAEALKAGRREFAAGDGECVGFVFPVYYWGVPHAVKEFISGLKITGGSGYVWSCITCGGHTGGAGAMLKRELLSAGLELKASFGVVMVENYIPMYDIPKDIDGILNAAEKELDGFAARLAAREQGDFDPCRGALSGLKTAVMYPFYKLGRKTGKFRAGAGCTGCGACAAVCPEQAIELREGRPEWVKSHCSMCTGCINRCPERAIEYGRGTEKRGRYYNPRLL